MPQSFHKLLSGKRVVVMAKRGFEKEEDSIEADSLNGSADLESSFFSHKKGKILYVTTISGFLPQFEKNDVSIAKSLGYEIHYASNFENNVYTIPDNYFESENIIRHHIGVTKSPLYVARNVKVIKQLTKLIDEEHINIVHCHNPMGGVVARIAAQRSKSKPYVIYTAHGLHFYKGAPVINWLLFYPVEKWLAHYTDEMVAINREDYSFMKGHFKLKQGGCFDLIHGVGVDINKFSPKPDMAMKKRDEMKIPREAFHIVTAAELNDNKNQKVVIEAISKIKNNNIYYTLCGKGNNKVKLENLINEKKSSKRVKLVGYRTDMHEVLQTADAFAFPSIREGLGVAAVEALASGVPLIVADNRGTREYAVDRKNSLVCNAKESESFKQAIEELSTNEALYRHLKSNCRETADNFSDKQTEKVMKKVYIRADKKVREQ